MAVFEINTVKYRKEKHTNFRVYTNRLTLKQACCTACRSELTAWYGFLLEKLRLTSLAKKFRFIEHDSLFPCAQNPPCGPCSKQLKFDLYLPT